MKTIREWLSEGLSTKHYLLAKKYEGSAGCVSWEDRVPSAHEAINSAIWWSMTSEGHDFWKGIYEQLKEWRYEKYSNNIFLKL